MAKTASGKNGKETKVYFRGSTAGLKIVNSANYMYMKYKNEDTLKSTEVA